MGDTGQQQISTSLLPFANHEGQDQALDWSEGDPHPGRDVRLDPVEHPKVGVRERDGSGERVQRVEHVRVLRDVGQSVGVS